MMAGYAPFFAQVQAATAQAVAARHLTLFLARPDNQLQRACPLYLTKLENEFLECPPAPAATALAAGSRQGAMSTTGGDNFHFLPVAIVRPASK
ncbi:hypothetical protein D3C72_1541470 [compost metagenome]